MDKKFFTEQEKQVYGKAGGQREYTKENYLHNGTKSQGQFANNSFNTTIEEPALNASGKNAKENGYGIEKR
ncbi:MAG: hypothetical protein E6344_13570 [Clostridium sp.]|uniref:hypothetical protein n=1 Tax=Clostridium culturomicium TaxID=1499683 RepID=UPI00059070E2|nr:hypothetical protein [Clostridium culturomicium]MDU4892594.1 hypothetical protein [Clostridium sp.]MDU7084722.1 hypothetical protein [Clostridium sp.]